MLRIHRFHVVDWHHLMHVHPLRRFRDPRARRHAIYLMIGLAISFLGYTLSTWHISCMPEGVWHGIAYGIHAAGLIPVLKHIEVVWALLTA